MKRKYILKRSVGAFLMLVVFVFIGLEVFQGQNIPNRVNENIFNYDENDPYIDRPTREALSHVVESDGGDLDIITDANGFDNFEIGVDFAEQMLVSNPLNPLQMQFGVNNSATGQNAYYTADGYNWTQSNPVYHPSTCCDPWSAWDGLGRLVYGSGVSNQYVYRSANGGQTYGPAILSVSGNDRNTLAAEQTGTGPFANYLYAAITPGNFSRSVNNGVSWTTTYAPSNTIPGTMIAVGPNGATNGGCVIYVTNTGSTAACTYTFHRSLDGGATFTVRSSLTTAGYVGTLNTAGRLVINNGRTRPYPMIAMDNSNGPRRGRLYLVYASNVPAGNGNKPDIRLRYSDDQGATWSAAVTVNDNASPQLSDQWFPAIWCEVTTGRLYIKWYDTRENPATYATNVYATYTDDGGATFAPNQKLTTTSWVYPNPACAPNTNCYRGDYDGMTANPKAGFAVWYDGRLGTYKNVGSYFPDFGMLATPAINTVHQTNSSVNYLINIPAVKLYTDVTTFSATISPAPATGSFAFEFPGGNTLNSYPNTKYIKVKTVGTVTPLGNYTVTITGQGSNGTPVHKRNVTLTVNTTVGPAPCEGFSDTKFPPAGFFEEFSGTNYWSRLLPSAYNIGVGSARFNSWSAPTGTKQSIVTNNFPNAIANTYLTFDEAYAPWSGGNVDSLIVEISSDFGSTYTTLIRLWGGLGAAAGPLNTVFTGGGQFTPTGGQWRPKIYLLPVGTNKVRLKAVSGFGNDIWVDNVCVQTIAAPVANSIGLVSQGMFVNDGLTYWRFNDTVKVFLHRTDFPNAAIDSAVSVPGGNAIVDVLFSRALNGTYYRVVQHRNSIETWSNIGVGYSRGSASHHNFVPDGASFGNNQAIVNTVPLYRGMYSGDCNQDSVIDGSDVGLVDNDAANFVLGYVVTDLTGDFVTDGSDFAIVDNNAANFVIRVAPPGGEPLDKFSTEETIVKFNSEAEREKYELTQKLLKEQNIKNSLEKNKKLSYKEFLKIKTGKNWNENYVREARNKTDKNIINNNSQVRENVGVK